MPGCPLRPLVLIVALAALTWTPLLEGGEELSPLDRAAQREKDKIAELFLELAGDLVEAKAKTPAQEALARVQRLAPEIRGLEELVQQADALAEDREPDDVVQRRIEKTRTSAAKAYEKLARVYMKEKDDPRYPEYLLVAYALDPSKSRLQKVADLAKKGPLLMHSEAHPFAAYVSLPKAWKAGKEWPVLVSVEGAGSNFPGNAQLFRDSRGSRDWITISPHALSCTNEIKYDRYPAYSKELVGEYNNRRAEFDIAGLMALLDFLQQHFGAAPRVAITGFSGGGNLCYGFLLHHPERVLCAAPACANFNPGLAQGTPPVEGGGPPVRIMTGENDPHRYLTHGKEPPGIEEQTDWAVKALAEKGFSNVERRMLPGVGHSPLASEVWKFVDEIVDAR